MLCVVLVPQTRRCAARVARFARGGVPGWAVRGAVPKGRISTYFSLNLQMRNCHIYIYIYIWGRLFSYLSQIIDGGNFLYKSYVFIFNL